MSHKNELYPTFLRLERLQTVITGGDEIALEKVSFMLKNSPSANIRIIHPYISEEIQELIKDYPNTNWLKDQLKPEYLNDVQVLIAGDEDDKANHESWKLAKSMNILVNVADTPDLCDFYLGGIITRGDLKIAISSNGQSPILVRRMREILEDTLPDSTAEIVKNLNQIKQRMTGSFKQRLESLLKLTQILKTSDEEIFKN